MGEPQEQPERLNGIVKWFNSAKGFGFITVEDSEDEVFVHQSNIDTSGYRSLREGEEVEFDLLVGEDGKKKAFHVTGPGGASPLGSQDLPRVGFTGRGGLRPFDPGYAAAAMYAYHQQQQHHHHRQQQQQQQHEQQHLEHQSPQQQAPTQQQQQQHSPALRMGGGGRGRGTPPPAGVGTPPGAGFYAPMPPDAATAAYMAAGYYPMPPPGAYGAFPAPFPRGRGGYFPGGRNWAGARPPPPGQPGFSSGLQVVVHNLPWDCTWQTLKDAFAACGDIERADVVFDSRGRSRGFGIVRFAEAEQAELAAEKMNNASIGGRVVSVRIDRFA